MKVKVDRECQGQAMKLTHHILIIGVASSDECWFTPIVHVWWIRCL